MKYIRFSIALGIIGLFIASLFNSCRQTAPTGPADTSSCCQGRLTLTVYDSATGHVLDGGGASLYDNDQLVSTKPMNDSGTVWDGLCPGHYHITLSKEGYHATDFALDSMGCNDTRAVHHTMVSEGTNSGDSCCNGRDYFTVEDSATHHILTGATIVLLNRTTGVSQSSETSSTNNGAIRFGNLCPGSYLCTITKDGYHSLTFDFEQGCDGVLSFTKSLLSTTTSSDTCTNGRIYVTVKDSSTQSALSGATLVIYKSGAIDSTAVTGDNGMVRFGNLTPGSYRVTINKDGYAQSVFEFTEDCNAEHGFTTALLATTTTNCDTASISLHVRDSVHQDLNINGATVTIRIDGHSDDFTTGTTDSSGYYFSHHNLPGHTTYIVTVSKDGYNMKSFSMQTGDCQNYGEAVYLSPR